MPLPVALIKALPVPVLKWRAVAGIEKGDLGGSIGPDVAAGQGVGQPAENGKLDEINIVCAVILGAKRVRLRAHLPRSSPQNHRL